MCASPFVKAKKHIVKIVGQIVSETYLCFGRAESWCEKNGRIPEQVGIPLRGNEKAAHISGVRILSDSFRKHIYSFCAF